MEVNWLIAYKKKTKHKIKRNKTLKDKTNCVHVYDCMHVGVCVSVSLQLSNVQSYPEDFCEIFLLKAQRQNDLPQFKRQTIYIHCLNEQRHQVRAGFERHKLAHTCQIKMIYSDSFLL